MFIVSAKEPAKRKMNAVSGDLESKRSKMSLWAQPWWALLVGHQMLPSHSRLEPVYGNKTLQNDELL